MFYPDQPPDGSKNRSKQSSSTMDSHNCYIVSDPHKEQECVSGIIVSITLNKHHSVKK